jgi:hypothetical protein
MPCILLTRSQVDTAQQIWDDLPGWQAYDLTLKAAAVAFPSNTDPTSVLAKTALLDRLYFTNLKGLLVPAATRIVVVFSASPLLSGCDLVTSIAQVAGKQLISFASKYVHFYFDSNLPLTDWYALYALTRHFRQPEARVETWRLAYQIYFDKILELTRLSQIEATAREMDHYLWLAGNWIYHQKHGQAAQQNNELKDYFGASERQAALEAVFGQLL